MTITENNWQLLQAAGSLPLQWPQPSPKLPLLFMYLLGLRRHIIFQPPPWIYEIAGFSYHPTQIAIGHLNLPSSFARQPSMQNINVHVPSQGVMILSGQETSWQQVDFSGHTYRYRM